MNIYKQNAINFVSKIPEFKNNLALMDNFLGNLASDQQQKLLYFLEKTELLFAEESLSGDYSCKTGIYFNRMTNSEIPLLINDIQNGKYDSYL